MATAEPTAVTTVKEMSELDCSVCHEAYTCPKVLPCGHLLCHQCLLSLGKSQSQPLCPLCQNSIVGPQDVSSGKKFEDVVETLPTDLAMEVLVRCDQLLKENRPCQACMTQYATSMCLTCGDFYCTHCAKGHTRMSVAKGHTVEEMSTLTPEKVAGSLRSFCSAHPDEVSKVHCSTHGTSVCLLCATTRHRQCQEVKPLDEKVGEDRAALRKMAATLTAAETQIDEAIGQLDQHLQDTQKDFNTAVADLDAMCQRFEFAIKARRVHLQSLMETECSDVTEAVNSGKACLLGRQGKLTVHKSVVQRAHGITTPCAVCGMSSSMEVCINDLDHTVTLPGDFKIISKVMLEIDSEAVARLEQQLKELGQIKVVSADVAAQPVFPLTFHDKHGQRILLSGDRTTAERNRVDSGGGTVFSAEPMLTYMLYEVRIEQILTQFSSDRIYLGGMTVAPETVDLPVRSGNLRTGVVLRPTYVKVNGVEKNSTVGAPLRSVRQGGRVGLALDGNRGLHLFIDGNHVELISSCMANPCYFMVDLYAYWKKVTTLPVRHVGISE